MKTMIKSSLIWTGPTEEMSTSVFERFRDLIYDNSGIVLAENKRPLVKARIQKRMRALRLLEYNEYLTQVMSDRTGGELQHLLDAISTNVTSFYRERHHFDFMGPMLGNWLSQGMSRLRIWSAACSTGEEPYTIAMEVLEALGQRSVDVKILATDLAAKVLRECQEGEYPSARVEPVPSIMRNKYLIRSGDRHHATYTVSKELRRLVFVRQFNLVKFPYAVKGPMDLVFCRNVMIYFDRDTRCEIVKEFRRILRPGGYLFVGHSESLTGLGGGFTVVRPSIYKRV
ncbi:MAG: protein-glutamate O-methyltransferase CheR [candidate division Zixibacteria bacterium]|nr:protein-glutamate O-methyltransferase CheR [candidate division Zixibacteria bacterium]